MKKMENWKSRKFKSYNYTVLNLRNNRWYHRCHKAEIERMNECFRSGKFFNITMNTLFYVENENLMHEIESTNDKNSGIDFYN